jgi:cytochrome c biogenesis protein CcmG/thiol:disulfide interchange protein DsbE
VPCAAEAPQLARLEASGANIVAVAIRDRPEDVARFLAQYGNPFSRIGKDDISAVQLSIGSSGVPETFVIDGRGVIRYQHIGDIRDGDVAVLLEELRKAGA